MKTILKIAAVAATGAALFAAAPASAGVHVGIGIGVPGVHVRVGVPGYYYGPGYYPPGPCDAYSYYYAGDCGYDVYDGPVNFGGVVVTGPHYYRWVNGEPLFWYRGGWRNWNGWRGVNFGWSHREGFGWHNGRWDRAWGREHWEHRENVRDHRENLREDRRDIRQDRQDTRFDRNHGADRQEIRHDRNETRQDRRDLNHDRHH